MADHSLERKIYYHDTDAGGVVYYGNYLKFLEEGRTELCLSRGVDTGVLFNQGVAFVVVHAEMDYKYPARYGDTIAVISRVEKIGSSSVHFYQEIRIGQTVAVTARVIWACVTADFKTRPVDASVRQALLAAA
ncbi:MAG TPA: thioesterase family protein [Candidatus Omnitrophota bacterium]|nr:thioesterase family protein [Candidatus Omnitrophota bacterium]HRZ14547.1 thioesterase family protein [Candidatus Omnitrophota bacterium]